MSNDVNPFSSSEPTQPAFNLTREEPEEPNVDQRTAKKTWTQKLLGYLCIQEEDLRHFNVDTEEVKGRLLNGLIGHFKKIAPTNSAVDADNEHEARAS